jgi:hypothetical protein
MHTRLTLLALPSPWPGRLRQDRTGADTSPTAQPQAAPFADLSLAAPAGRPTRPTSASTPEPRPSASRMFRAPYLLVQVFTPTARTARPRPRTWSNSSA